MANVCLKTTAKSVASKMAGEEEGGGGKSVLGKKWSDTSMNKQRLYGQRCSSARILFYPRKLLETQLQKKSPF